MAKRKRLTPAIFGANDEALSGLIEPHRDRPPIARVAAETATEAAFAEVAGALAAAREEGRLITKLPLDAIETAHLVRDRIAFDTDEMAALKASLKARGQQVPVEVVSLGSEGEGRFGLISGLRRVMALREIGAGEVLALIRRPETSVEAYLAMVEENEIRAGVSFYERARVASESARLGLFETTQAAIAHLFAQASPAKRSKIGSFVSVHEALGADLRFPAAIPERLGLEMAKALTDDRGFAGRLSDRLARTPPQTAAEERGVIEAVLPGRGKTAPKPSPRQIAPGIFAERGMGRLVLSGPAVTDELEQALAGWLKSRP
jgi:ParB family chromosome partitioning protein